MRSNEWIATRCLAALALAVVLSLTSSAWSDNKSDDQPDVVKRINAAQNVLTEIMATPDKAIPSKVLSDARCMVIIPSMIKIAVGFGGNHGKGIATCRTTRGWSAPAPVSITGGSFGLGA
jgi:SH3 domain-containing YSC84-like protein 1